MDQINQTNYIDERNQKMKALLLAAGEGKRLRPLTESLPKPMISIGGRPILEQNVNLLARYGIRDIAINLHHCPDAVRNHFGDGSRFGVGITYSYEPKLLGTAGAVKQLESYFHNTFIVIYGDNLINCDLKRLISFHRGHGGIVTIAVHFREDMSNSGVVALDGRNRVIHFLEKPQGNQPLSNWVNAGVLVLEREVLQYIPPDAPSDFGREILPNLLAKGEQIYGYKFSGDEQIWWIDRMEDYKKVQAIFSNQRSNNE
jgi:NDP-sugar pyrophosphorylase family protein